MVCSVLRLSRLLFSVNFTNDLFIKEKKAEKEPPPLGKYAKGLISVFKSEGRWLFAAYLTGAICLFALFGILFYISDILEKEHHIDGILKGSILAIPLLFMTTTSYITGSKIGKNMPLMKKLIILGLLLMTASFASLIFFESLIPFFSVLVVSSIGTGLVLPCINSFITGSVPTDRRGFVTSLYGSVRFLGVAIGPPIFSTLMDWSRTGMFLITAGLTLFAALLSLVLIHVKKKNQRRTVIHYLKNFNFLSIAEARFYFKKGGFPKCKYTFHLKSSLRNIKY